MDARSQGSGVVVGPDNVHGRLLVKFIERVEAEVGVAAQQGCKPVLDAVETVRVLRALVEHRPSYETVPVDAEGVARWSLLTPSVEWSVIPAAEAP